MERFYNNNDDNDEEIVGFIDQQGIIDVMHMDLAQNELNQNLLKQAIEIAKGGWFWAFKSTEKRLAEVESVYRKLASITGDHEAENDDDILDLERE